MVIMDAPLPSFPALRLRRLRQHPVLRELVRETRLDVGDLIQPFFVRPGSSLRREIASMPGQYQLSVDQLVREAEAVRNLGIRACILFGIPESKDPEGTSALRDDGIVAQAVRSLKRAMPDLLVITDECFCEYTSHGHCGLLSERSGRLDVDNDRTLRILVQQCVVHARAGADLVAPSGMMDGMVQAIRAGLDAAGFEHVPILSYAAKYASAFYGPFREAAESPPQFGDRSTYQMDPANSDEALREVGLDLQEGADMVMVKPGMPYLDVIRRVKDAYGAPTFAYQVSGEYAMLKAAAQNGWLDERACVLEALLAFKRAGADGVLTYFARDVARWLKP